MGRVARTIFGANWERTEDERKVCTALEKVAGEVGAKNITAGESELQEYVCIPLTYLFFLQSLSHM